MARNKCAFRLTKELYEFLRCQLRLTLNNYILITKQNSQDIGVNSINLDSIGKSSKISNPTEDKVFEIVEYFEEINAIKELEFLFIPNEALGITIDDVFGFIISGRRWTGKYTDEQKINICHYADYLIYQYGKITLGEKRLKDDQKLLEIRKQKRKKVTY